MRSCKIVHVRAKDFHQALYVGVDDDTWYLVGTDHLCPDCTTPMIVLEGGEADADGDGVVGAMLTYHDSDCVVAADNGGPVLNRTDRKKVTDIRRRHLDAARDAWSELA